MGWLTLTSKKKEDLNKHPFLSKALFFLEWFIRKGITESSSDEEEEVEEDCLSSTRARFLEKRIINSVVELATLARDCAPKGKQCVYIDDDHMDAFNAWHRILKQTTGKRKFPSKELSLWPSSVCLLKLLSFHQVQDSNHNISTLLLSCRILFLLSTLELLFQMQPSLL
jgi:hypothetical protein